jgi:hypothetical protein
MAARRQQLAALKEELRVLREERTHAEDRLRVERELHSGEGVRRRAAAGLPRADVAGRLERGRRQWVHAFRESVRAGHSDRSAEQLADRALERSLVSSAALVDSARAAAPRPSWVEPDDDSEVGHDEGEAQPQWQPPARELEAVAKEALALRQRAEAQRTRRGAEQRRELGEAQEGGWFCACIGAPCLGGRAHGDSMSTAG